MSEADVTHVAQHTPGTDKVGPTGGDDGMKTRTVSLLNCYTIKRLALRNESSIFSAPHSPRATLLEPDEHLHVSKLDTWGPPSARDLSLKQAPTPLIMQKYTFVERTVNLQRGAND